MTNDAKQRVKSQFSKNAESYFTSESHANGQDLSLLVEWLQPRSEWTALDVATGGGHVAKTLSPYVRHVFSTDLTKEMLANTAKHFNQDSPNIWYVIADAESLPFLDHTFEIVTCRIAPHHFPNPDAFISEVARVLKPNGSFLMIDNVVPDKSHLAEFMNTMEKLRDESHVQCLSIETWRQLFCEAGLSVIKSESRKKTYRFPQWVKRTADSPGQIEEVENYILRASNEIHAYFHVQIADKHVQSLQVDEWMVLCQKKSE
jgi:ubiquinone/menaquinone biosynthesis C-methylase UbiE